jgi:site-specific DNA recombinase
VAKNPINKNKYKKIKRTSRRRRPIEDWIPFNVPRIIENNTLYESIQKTLIKNQRYACKPRKYNYLLSGIVHCECGSPRVGDGCDGKNFYYRCAQRIYKFPLKHKCKIQGMNAVVLDKSFWKELVAFLKNPVLIKKQAEEWLRSQTNSDIDKQEKERLNGLINKTKEEEKRYAKAYGEGTLDFEQFRDLMRNAKNKKLVFEEQRITLNQKITQEGIDTIQLNELIEEAKRIIQALKFDNKFQLIRDIIDRCIVKGGNTVEVWGHLPLFAVNMGYEPISRNCGITKCRKIYIV